MATTIRQELEDEFLSTIRKGQDIALDALKPLVQAVPSPTPKDSTRSPSGGSPPISAPGP